MKKLILIAMLTKTLIYSEEITKLDLSTLLKYETSSGYTIDDFADLMDDDIKKDINTLHSNESNFNISSNGPKRLNNEISSTIIQSIIRKELERKDQIKRKQAVLINNIDTITSQGSYFGSVNPLSYTPTNKSSVTAFTTVLTTGLFAATCYFKLPSYYIYGVAATGIFARISTNYWNFFQKNRQQRAWQLLQSNFKIEQNNHSLEEKQKASDSFINRIGAFGHDIMNSVLYKKNQDAEIKKTVKNFNSELNHIKDIFKYLDMDGFNRKDDAISMKNRLLSATLTTK